MPYETGRFATQTMDDFLARTPHPFHAWAQEIKERRPLVQTHFDQARQYAALTREAARIPLIHLDAESPDNDGVQFITRYMNHLKQPGQNFTDYDEYTPVAHNTFIETDRVLDMRRAFPLHFASQNVEASFNTSSNDIIYSMPGFSGAVSLGLVLAYNLDNTLTEKTPIIVPHSDGLFFGSAVPGNKENYAPQNYRLAKVVAGQPVEMSQPYFFSRYWEPQVALNLYSFVPDYALSVEQKKLVRVFEQAVWDDEQAAYACADFLHGYMSAGEIVPTQQLSDATNYISNAMRSVTSSPEWKAATRTPKALALN